MSPKVCLRRLRLDRAKLLLEEGALTIEQVALRVGWQHRSHFERRFKQLHGKTPAQYRMMRRISLPLSLEKRGGSQFGYRAASSAIE